MGKEELIKLAMTNRELAALRNVLAGFMGLIDSMKIATPHMAARADIEAKMVEEVLLKNGQDLEINRGDPLDAERKTDQGDRLDTKIH